MSESEGKNPFRFSSEFNDDSLGLVYYNYRHHNVQLGCWMTRDPVFELSVLNLYTYDNSSAYDILGLRSSATLIYRTDKVIQWYEFCRYRCEEHDCTYTWVLDPNGCNRHPSEYERVVKAELVWSGHEKWKAFLEGIKEEFIPTIDEFVKGQLSDATINLFAEQFPVIKKGMSVTEVYDVVTGAVRVVDKTFNPPAGSYPYFHDGNYYRLLQSTDNKYERQPFGFDDENTSLIVKPCNRQNEGTFYVIRNELHSDIQEGVWEK